MGLEPITPRLTAECSAIELRSKGEEQVLNFSTTLKLTLASKFTKYIWNM